MPEIPWNSETSKKRTDEFSKRLDPSEKVANGAFVYSDIYMWHPGDCPESDGVFKSAGSAVVEVLHELRSNAERLAENKFATEEGAARILAPYQEKVVAEAVRQRRQVQAAAAELTVAEGELFSPGESDPNDMERRAWYEALSNASRDEFEAQARRGEHVEVVKALARSPVPGRALSFGRATWRAEVEAKQAGRVRALETRRRALAWAEGVLNVAPRVAQSSPASKTPVEGPLARLTRARSFMKPAPTA